MKHSSEPMDNGYSLSGPVSGGTHGWPFGAATVDLAALGYQEDEWFMSGSATAYQLVDPPGRSVDGQWVAQRTTASPYRTRLLIRRPVDPERFNGTVVLFWLNVSIGFDILTGESPELYEGFAFVGVTAQRVAVHSYPDGPQRGLGAWDPERYGSLEIPSDDVSYDIFTQAARAVRGSSEVGSPLAPLEEA